MTINSDTTPVDESPMFAPVPTWERGKKRRGFGRTSRAAEPRSFAFDEAPETIPAAAPVVDNEVPITDAGFATAPVYATRAKAKSSSAPVAIVAGLVLIGGVAAAGWYYSQPHGQTGVAELTPGAATTTTTTTGATSSDTAPPPQVAQNTPPAAAAKTTTTTTTRAGPARNTHTGGATTSARSAAASDSGQDASVTAPVPSAARIPAAPAASGAPMPLPTPGVAPPASAATPAAPLVLNIPPAANAPAAAPQTTAPPPTEVPQA